MGHIVLLCYCNIILLLYKGTIWTVQTPPFPFVGKSGSPDTGRHPVNNRGGGGRFPTLQWMTSIRSLRYFIVFQHACSSIGKFFIDRKKNCPKVGLFQASGAFMRRSGSAAHSMLTAADRGGFCSALCQEENNLYFPPCLKLQLSKLAPFTF